MHFTCSFEEFSMRCFCMEGKTFKILKNKKKKEDAQMSKIKVLVQLREPRDAPCFPKREFIWANNFVAVESSSVLCSKHLWMGREWHCILCTLINEAGIPRFAIMWLQWGTSTRLSPSTRYSLPKHSSSEAWGGCNKWQREKEHINHD